MTQSFGELMSVAYRVAPKVRLSVRKLPVRTVMSDIYICLGELNSPIQWRGAFYPEWKLNQRDGVTIDIPVEQTVEDIAAGEDMWIRKAIEYIESKR